MDDDKRNRESQQHPEGARQSHSARKRERKQKQEQMKGRAETQRAPEPPGSTQGRKLPLPD